MVLSQYHGGAEGLRGRPWPPGRSRGKDHALATAPITFPMTHSSDPHRLAETASSRRRGLPARAAPPGDGQTPAFMFAHCRLRVDTEGGVVRKAWGPERTQSHPLKSKNSLSQGN